MPSSASDFCNSGDGRFVNHSQAIFRTELRGEHSARQDIRRIGLSKKREKRLDFTLVPGDKVIEIEAKGTVIPGNVPGMIAHTHAKKVGKDPGTPRYGFVVQLRKEAESLGSIIHVTDPDGSSFVVKKNLRYFANYYLPYLMFILDNPAYNKVVKRLKDTKKLSWLFLGDRRFRYLHTHGGIRYVGNCFDDRLMIQSISESAPGARNLDQLFNKLTNNHGETKYFLGIDERLIVAFRKGDKAFIRGYRSAEEVIEMGDKSVISTYSDGVMFIKSFRGKIGFLSDLFPERDVKSRLYEYRNYSMRQKHECGSPCRSREKAGKACEIKTYRTSCHFHR